MKVLLFIILLTNPALAGVVCLDNGKLRYTEDNKTRVQAEPYCFIKNTEYIASQSCHLKDCGKKIASKPMSAMLQPTGSPLFQFCRDLAGEGMIAEYWDGANWKNEDLCFFGKHKFVSIRWLIKTRNP